MKFEMKVELEDKQALESLIQGVYFDDLRNGKLSNNEKMEIKVDKKDPLSILFRGLDNTIIRGFNSDIIDGTFRFVVNESSPDNIELIPCSLYCIVENGKYSFY
jgi:hypothetical protein